LLGQAGDTRSVEDAITNGDRPMRKVTTTMGHEARAFAGYDEAPPAISVGGASARFVSPRHV